MKKYYFVILVIVFSCDTKKSKTKEYSNSIDSIEMISKKAKSQDSLLIINEENLDWTHHNYFEFKKYKEYKINDTINIDLNGNGVFEKVFFDNTDCPKIIFQEDNKELFSLGCGNKPNNGFHSEIGWVDLWCVVADKKVWEVLFTENGDIDKDTIIDLDRPSIYIGKEEAGGGIITFKKNKPYWVHQSD